MTSFRIFTISFLIGLILIVVWNLNHHFCWFESGDSLWGCGIASIIFGAAYHIDKTSITSLQKVISRFFLFLSISNLVDEVFFNPCEINLIEFVIAFLALLAIINKEKFCKHDDRPSGPDKKIGS